MKEILQDRATFNLLAAIVDHAVNDFNEGTCKLSKDYNKQLKVWKRNYGKNKDLFFRGIDEDNLQLQYQQDDYFGHVKDNINIDVQNQDLEYYNIKRYDLETIKK